MSSLFGAKRSPYFCAKLLAQRDELLRAHHVDVGERAARIGRVAEAEDRADIGLAHVGEHAFLEAARGFQRLDREQAMLQLRHVDRVGIELGRLQLGEARPQPLRAGLRIIVEPLGVLAPEAAALLDHLFEQRLLPRVDRLRAEVGFGGLQDLPREIDRDLVVERQRPDRHAGLAPDILDHRGGHALGQHQVAFADVSADHA